MRKKISAIKPNPAKKPAPAAAPPVPPAAEPVKLSQSDIIRTRIAGIEPMLRDRLNFIRAVQAEGSLEQFNLNTAKMAGELGALQSLLPEEKPR